MSSTTVANFKIEYLRYLDAQGKITGELPGFAQNPQKLIYLYEQMTLLRTFDNKAIALQRTGKMGTYASTLGQEAVSVAIGDAMQSDDVLCPAYREYGAQFQRGVKMAEILTYWGGDERASNFADNTQDFPICVPIGTQYLHATGVAVAFKIRQQARVAVTVCGDGATSQGDFYEALNLAGTWQLPIVFVVNNNQWAISVARKVQSHATTLAQKAIAGGFSGEQVDGNDIIAMRFAMERALAKARAGGGPSLIEAVTYRLCDHTTADDANRYRDAAELAQAWQEEPLLRLREYLISQGHWSNAQEEQLLTKCSSQIEAAVTEYLNVSPPLVSDMFDYMYAELPHDLAVQREEALAVAPQVGSVGGHGHG